MCLPAHIGKMKFLRHRRDILDPAVTAIDLIRLYEQRINISPYRISQFHSVILKIIIGKLKKKRCT